MIVPVVAGEVTPTGELQIAPESHVAYRQHLLNLKGKRVDITIKPYRKKKSRPQRDYYFGVVVELLASFTGHTKDEMHTALKATFLAYQENGVTFIRSTEDLTTDEAEAYHEQIRNWAAEVLDVYIPLPNESAIC